MNWQWWIFWASLNPAKSSEQAGTRPVLVVSAEEVNQVLSVVTVVPLTTAKPGRRVYSVEALLPAANTGLPNDSIAMSQQVRTIAKDRLIHQCGQLEDIGLRELVRQALRVHLDL